MQCCSMFMPCCLGSQPKIRRAQSVMDTPKAKQHFTALARQRLRERRSWTSQKDDLNQSLIDESPLKQVENHTRAPFVKFDSKARRRLVMSLKSSFFANVNSQKQCKLSHKVIAKFFRKVNSCHAISTMVRALQNSNHGTLMYCPILIV